MEGTFRSNPAMHDESKSLIITVSLTGLGSGWSGLRRIASGDQRRSPQEALDKKRSHNRKYRERRAQTSKLRSSSTYPSRDDAAST
mmetsp:Transcript_1125/g.2239  ORF Transcript_1125/g.2239 Transcript_1125/m.2239 type:complete len:86 (-) Transcript_1125:357-614(-)